MTVRNIERRPRLTLKTLATHIAHHTDDCAERVVAEAETFADGIFIRPVAARESFVHNQSPRRFAKPKRAAILLREIAARQQRDAHRLKVARSHSVHFSGEWRSARRRITPFKRDFLCPVAAGEGKVVDCRGVYHTWRGAQPLQQLIEEIH